MKIAFAVEHFNPHQGGAEKYVWELTQWCLEQGHQLTVYTSGDYEPMVGVTMELIDPDAEIGASPQHRFAYALQKALVRKKYDVVQGFNHVWPGDVLMLHGGVHLAFEHYNALSASTPLGRTLKKWIYKTQKKYRSLRDNEKQQFADPKRRFIAVSERVAEDMIRYYPAVRGRVRVIQPGLDVENFSSSILEPMRGVLRKERGVASDKTIFLFVAHNYRLKGLHDLLRALPLLEKQQADYELWVVGRGHRKAYKRLAKRLGVGQRVHFLGAIDDIRMAYVSADVLVHPSYYDTFGGVVLEAMACGLSVVVSTNCGVASRVDAKSGVLISMPCRSQEIADAMVQASKLHPPPISIRSTEDNFRDVMTFCLQS